MHPDYHHPGLYIAPTSLPSAINQTESAVVAFIGLTEMAQDRNQQSLTLQPVMISSLDEYQQYFGSAPATPVQLQVTESGTGVQIALYRSQLILPEQLLYYSVAHFFASGGRSCYIISAGDYRSPITTKQLQQALGQLSAEHPATILLCPDICNATPRQQPALNQMLLNHCAGNKHRFCILDVPDAIPGQRDSVSSVDHYIRECCAHGTEVLPFGALYYPYLHSDISVILDNRQITIARHKSATAKTRNGTIEPGTSIADKALTARHPRLLKAAEHFIHQQCFATLPPSGAMAAIYQQSDADRGVWKAPANVELAATHSPAVAIDNQMNQQLNSGLSRSIAVNAIRQFPRRGIRVWGARTLAGYDPEWRYINVRRLAGMIHHSVSLTFSQWTRDNNNQTDWNQASAMLDNFLLQLWRQGGLSGSKAEQAYFVNLGLGKSMTQDDIVNGRMIIHIGFAPLSPAEFVVLTFAFQLKA